ncbi:Vomeronasal 2, receptor 3 [Apodemus speciosus]|uniref:Vomeronasal 2, receptor 3 n=1 Tax=Apodemus speciosus TaxID=105296 RepID=A0ABQ0EKI6_APOSI
MLLKYIKDMEFTTHDGSKIELDKSGDIKSGYYDILNWQMDDDGEIAFVKG